MSEAHHAETGVSQKLLPPVLGGHEEQQEVFVMQIHITGRHIDTGASLREHVEGRLSDAVGKYFSDDADVNVTFSKVGHAYRSDCAVHLDSGMHLQATARNANIYSSFEETIEKIEKQLRRYKRKLKNHHSKVTAEPAIMLEADNDADLSAAIIAEHVTDLPNMTLAAAIEIVEEGLMDHVIFRRAGDKDLSNTCLVRRRPDGNIGWIDLAA